MAHIYVVYHIRKGVHRMRCQCSVLLIDNENGRVFAAYSVGSLVSVNHNSTVLYHIKCFNALNIRQQETSTHWNQSRSAIYSTGYLPCSFFPSWLLINFNFSFRLCNILATFHVVLLKWDYSGLRSKFRKSPKQAIQNIKLNDFSMI